MKGYNILQLERDRLDVSDNLLSAVCMEHTGAGKETESAWLIDTNVQMQAAEYTVEFARLSQFINQCLVHGFRSLMILKKPSGEESSSNGL